MSNDELFEDLVRRYKEAHPELTCARACGRGTQPMHFRTVRRNPALPDGMRNLETVCKWCTPEWES